MSVGQNFKRERAHSVSRSSKRRRRPVNGEQSPTAAAVTEKPVKDQSQRGSQTIDRAKEDPVAARLWRLVLRPDDETFTDYYQDMVLYFIGGIITNAAQKSLNVYSACMAGRFIDRVLTIVERPKRWALMTTVPADLPMGLVKLKERTVTYLKTTCEELERQVYDRRFNVESLLRFGDVLRTVMQPLMEPYLSRALKLSELPKPPPPEFVTLLSNEQRAALSAAFTNTVVLLEENQLTAASLVHLRAAINAALVSLGKPIRRVVSPERIADDAKLRARMKKGVSRYLPLQIKGDLQGLEQGYLSLDELATLPPQITRALDDARAFHG